MPDIRLVQGASRRRSPKPKAVPAAPPPAIAAPEPDAVEPRVIARAAPQELAILRESVAEPIVVEPAVESVVEPFVETAGGLVIEPVLEPVKEQYVEPAIDPIIQPNRERTSEAAVAVVSEAASVAPPVDTPADAADAVPAAAPVPATVAAVASGSTDPTQTAPAPQPIHAGGPPSSGYPRAPEPIRAIDLLWLGLAFVLIIGTGFGIRDPWPADEPRFAAVARDMVLTGQWLLPHVGGDLYQDKPPFFFWLLALCYALTGSIKASLMIPSMLAAAGVTFLIYNFGRRLVSREAGVASAILVVSTLQFVQTMRGAQIDPTLCFLTTLSLYALLRHLLLGPAWHWYAIGGFVAGLGVITKGVGFLPVLIVIPFLMLRRFDWKRLAPVDAGKGGWRWWLAPLAMVVGISVWFVPMLVAVAMSGAPEYIAYRDEILFKQTVGRYATAWHHVKGWSYFIVNVIPALWLPWSLLLIWLVPGFRRAWQERDARIWLPLSWVLLVILFFSASPGKRGTYVLPALPALAMASLPLIRDVIAKKSVRIVSIATAALFWLAGIAAMVVTSHKAIPYATTPLLVTYLAISTVCIGFALWRAPVAAFPAGLAALAIWFSFFVAPLMNGERSGRDFTRAMLAQVKPEETLGLVAYKEQFLLYLDRPTVNFGHRRWLEGPQEAYDASAWLAAAPNRVLLVPDDTLEPCFTANLEAIGRSSRDHWHLVRAPAAPACVAKGNADRALAYDPTR
jgi:4-amino-4-deoxy-L-arabinose transferase-like glycosyltransferase